MIMDSVNTELFRGRVDTIILSVLKDKPHYGYEILELIVKNSVSHFEIKQSTLYNSLKRLECNGLVSSYEGEETNGAKRKYYFLTTEGKEYLEKEQKEWQYTRTLLDKLVSEEIIDLTAISPPYNPKELRPLTHRAKFVDENNLTTEQVTFNVIPLENSPLAAVEPQTDINNKQELSPNLHLPEYKSIIPNKDNETSDFILAREKASSRLGLGDYSSKDILFSQKERINSNEQPTLSELGVDYDNNLGRNYRDALSAIFTYNNDAHNVYDLSNEPLDRSLSSEDNLRNDTMMIRSQHFNDMKNSLTNDGYKVQVYNKANSSNYYYMNYYYSNKLLRDSLLFSFIVLFIELMFLALFHQPLKILYWTTLSISIIIPTYALSIYFSNPNKRIRAKYKFSRNLSISMAIFLVLSILNFLISSQFKVAKDTYTIYIILFNIPIFSIVSFILFRTNKYHLKK